jgi:DNA-binding response OmpR family regulator
MMRAGRRILIVDDDGALRQSLAEQLELHGEFVVLACDAAARAIEMVETERFDAILLDLGLPDMHGDELCRRLRSNGIHVPIIMLTGADSEADTIRGLEAGADDYVTKPFRLSVLLARLRANLRQSEHTDDAEFTIGPYTFRPSAKLLTEARGGRKVRLTEKETAILKFLLRAGDKAIARDILLDEVWGYNAGVTTHTLETHIYRLRQKIERDPAHAEILVTEQGGYRLIS